ncbi:MAG: hypothetical protein IJM74_10095 [Bacteroidales bacterium]|nr:hypothetical protein [Bacteroidales bacterium]
MTNRPIRPLLFPFAIAFLLDFSPSVSAQFLPRDALTRLKFEVRADAEAWGGQSSTLGFHGRYFNIMAGGNLGNSFSYYFRQRMKPEAGSIAFFDNTDFLYLNYQPSPRWRLRFGKDAMALGGFEYDAPPIDEYLTSEYWNNIYCFQLAASAAYLFADGRHTLTFQASQSPYLRSLGLNWDDGLWAYNLQWGGALGQHWQVLWSTSLIERQRGTYMTLTMLGTRVAYQRWSLYLDLMHHALGWNDWGRNYGGVLRSDLQLSPSLTLFVKGSCEKNTSKLDLASPQWLDQLVPAGHTFTKGGLGCEYRPKGMETVRLHCYAALLFDHEYNAQTWRSFTFNMGASWGIDFATLIHKE